MIDSQVQNSSVRLTLVDAFQRLIVANLGAFCLVLALVCLAGMAVLH